MRPSSLAFGSFALAALMGAAAVAPAAAAEVPPTSAKPCDGVALTGMNWATETLNIFRLRNTTDQDITGTFRLRGGGQAREVTVPAKSEVFVGVAGDIRTNRSPHGEFVWTGSDGYAQCSTNKMGNSVFATGHIKIELTAEGDLAQIPVGFAVRGTSSIETITWTWDGTAFVASGDKGGQQGWFVHETAEQFGLGSHWGVLDVPMTQSYTLTHDALPAHVSIAVDHEPGTVPGFDPSLETDAAYVNESGHFWYTDGGKYQANAAVLSGAEVPVVPEVPEVPPTTPEVPPVVPPTTPEVPVTPEPQEPADVVEPQLPHTGAGLASSLLPLAALSTVAGAGLVHAARRRS